MTRKSVETATGRNGSTSLTHNDNAVMSHAARGGRERPAAAHRSLLRRLCSKKHRRAEPMLLLPLLSFIERPRAVVRKELAKP